MEESTSREKVLKKVRHALIYKTDNPYPHADMDTSVYKPLSDTPDVHFAETFTHVGGVFIYCENEGELVAALSALTQELKWDNIQCRVPELQYLLTRAAVIFDSGEENFLNTKVAVTDCEFLISRLGSIMVSSKHGRRLNAFADTHVVIAHTGQLVEELKDAFDAVTAKYQGKLPSMLTVVTGPSRTADIEKTLVMGAHGPRELIVLLVEGTLNLDEI